MLETIFVCLVMVKCVTLEEVLSNPLSTIKTSRLWSVMQGGGVLYCLPGDCVTCTTREGEREREREREILV